MNANETKCMAMSRDQNSGRNHSIKTDNNSFERVEELKKFGDTLTYLLHGAESFLRS